ncbi:MAG TPA: hypothetical protein DGT23_30170 [Micromonosporaceae bacterium]|nr:hypothetical protein [Micromonosporaceae bacterium]
MTDAELSTVQLIAAKVGGLPLEPSCPGPLLVHADGAFECHGPDCPGATAVFHSDDVLDPCQRHPEIRTMHACTRCAINSDSAAMLEHVCSGQQIEHDDGTFDCTAGEKCLGVDEFHVSSASCRMFGPCTKQCEPLTPEAAHGLECVTCGADLREPAAPAAVVVGRFAGQMFACRGACAERRMGNPDGTGEASVPLAQRVEEWEATA